MLESGWESALNTVAEMASGRQAMQAPLPALFTLLLLWVTSESRQEPPHGCPPRPRRS